MELTLVSFAPSEEGRVVHGVLRELGHTINTIVGPSWLTSGRRPDVAQALAFFIGSRDYPREQLLTALADSPCAASLGIFHRDAAPWDRDLLGRCSDFVAWPCSSSELALRLERMQSMGAGAAPRVDEQRLLEEFAALNLVGRSPAFLASLGMIRKLARCEVPVLIEGETGTGKELAARAIHYLGARRDHPFVPVNCGAIPDNLIENELFGHARGAFTDAREAQPGLVNLAERGTLFLDEVDALSAKAQITLLRFLQYQEYKPLGGRVVARANVRVVAACNADIRRAVEQGTFRQDLFFRLNIAPLALPALRERGTDIAILAEHFVRNFRERYRQPQRHLAADTMRWLLAQRWPGNVRELESFIHREFVLADGDAVHLRPELSAFRERRRNPPERRGRVQPGDIGLQEYKAKAVADLEKEYLVNLLAETAGNVSLAARRAGKERRALGKLIKKHGINPRALSRGS